MNKKRLIILFLLIGTFFLLIGTSSYIAYADSGWDTDYGSGGSSYSYGGGGSSYSYSYGGSSSSYSWSSSSSSSSYHSSGPSKPLTLPEKVDWIFGIACFFLYFSSLACRFENKVKHNGLLYLGLFIAAIASLVFFINMNRIMYEGMDEGSYISIVLFVYIILDVIAYYILHALDEDFPIAMIFAGFVSFITLMFQWMFGIANLVALAISYVAYKMLGVPERRRKHFKKWDYKDISDIELQEYIPNETVASLKKKLFNLFYEVQMAWMEFDYDTLRDICTNELATTYIGQLNSLKVKNGKNVMNGFKVLKSNIVDIRRTEDNIVKIDFLLRVKFRDYVINTKTHCVERGFKLKRICNDYRLVFDLYKNLVDGKLKCPKCGAVIVPNKDGICEYCHSKIIYTNDKVILSKKGML